MNLPDFLIRKNLLPTKDSYREARIVGTQNLILEKKQIVVLPS